MKPIETLNSREVAESSLRAKAKSNLQMIGQDSHANWVVRDLAGQRGGLFVNRGEALRFAMLDDNGGPRAVVMVPGVLEFGIDVCSMPRTQRGLAALTNGAIPENLHRATLRSESKWRRFDGSRTRLTATNRLEEAHAQSRRLLLRRCSIA